MKKILLSILLLLCLCNPVYAQISSISDPAYLITNGTNNDFISATRMTDTTALIAFRDNADSKGKAVVATFSNGSWSISSPTYLISGGTNNIVISATRMTDTTAIIAFSDAGDSNKGKAVVATIANGLITCSNMTYLIAGGTANYAISATRMTDTTALIAFRDNADIKGKAVVATISNGTISCSNPTYLIAGGTENSYISATRMTDTTAIIAFYDAGNSGNGRAVVATISGTIISCSIPTYFISGGTVNIYISTTRMTDNTAIIAFRDQGNGNKGTAVVATIANGLITCSNPTYLITNGVFSSDISATRMTDTTAIIAFRDDSALKGKAVVATIANGLITCSNPTYLITNGADNTYISATRMTDTTAAISFRNITDSSKGTVVMATIGSTPIPGYPNKLNGVIINTINEVIPAKINGI